MKIIIKRENGEQLFAQTVGKKLTVEESKAVEKEVVKLNDEVVVKYEIIFNEASTKLSEIHDLGDLDRNQIDTVNVTVKD